MYVIQYFIVLLLFYFDYNYYRYICLGNNNFFNNFFCWIKLLQPMARTKFLYLIKHFKQLEFIYIAISIVETIFPEH